MYYRVAIQREGDQLDRTPSWQWRSTVLSSLQTLFQFLRLYGALPQDQLRVFSSSSREGLEAQRAQENRGYKSDSVTAARFLLERMICSPQVAQRTSEREEGSYQVKVSTAFATHPSMNESCKGFTTLDRWGLSALERKRLELESGAGGDHDLPYRFTGPSSLPQAIAWMMLLVRAQDGEWHP
jgi:hypothetical protein